MMMWPSSEQMQLNWETFRWMQRIVLHVSARLSRILSAGERECCDFAAKPDRSLARSGNASADHCPICQGPNRVLYSLSRCAQTAMLQVTQRSYRDALIQPQELQGAKRGHRSIMCCSILKDAVTCPVTDILALML